MASTILSTLFGKPIFSVQNEKTGRAIWTDLGIVDVEFMLSSENTDQPLSNQQVSNDSVYQSILSTDIQSVKIMSPTRIRVTALCSNLSTVKSIISYFDDSSNTMTVNSKSIITQSLAISEVDIEQSPEIISAVKIIIVFERAPTAQATKYSPAQAADQSVYGVTLQNPPSVVPLATLTKAISSASSAVTKSVSGALIDNIGGPFIMNSSKLS